MTSMFDKLGGAEALKSILSDFYQELYHLSDFKGYFRDVSQQKIIEHQCHFFAFALGKPVEIYSDEQLAQAHQPHHISDHAFTQFANLFLRTLIDHGIHRNDVKDIMILIYSKRGFIVHPTSANA